MVISYGTHRKRVPSCTCKYGKVGRKLEMPEMAFLEMEEFVSHFVSAEITKTSAVPRVSSTLCKKVLGNQTPTSLVWYLLAIP